MNQLIKDSIYNPIYKNDSLVRSFWIGNGILALLTLLLFLQQYLDLKISNSLNGGLMAAGATCLGSLPILFSQEYSKKTYDTLLGFGAGVMLSACFFSLIMPALFISKNIGLNSLLSSMTVGVGIIFGAGFMFVVDRFLPHYKLLDIKAFNSKNLPQVTLACQSREKSSTKRNLTTFVWKTK